MIKTLLSVLALTTAALTTSAQQFPYGQFSRQELDIKNYPKDTSAHAYVMNEYGTSRIDVTSDDMIKVIYEYHVKIKILDNKGFDAGDIRIASYTGGEELEQVDQVKGITTYTDDKGGAQQAELDPSKIFTVKENKYFTSTKFALPALKPGCIVEYSYRLVSPYIYQFPAWQFQTNIPKVNSVYEVHIPAFWTYNASLRGPLKLTTNTSDVERGCFATHGASCDCSHIVYGMKDVPAFIEEEDMTAPKNYLSAINFQLSDYINPYNSQKVRVTKEWKDIDYNLKKADRFGAQIKRKDALKKYIDPVIASKTSDLDKAKAVYAYIQKNIKWNGFYTYGSEGPKKALDNHTGTIGDINLTLVTALNAAGLNADAVLLSTRDHGIVNKLYPVEDEFDYVIAKLNIGEESYLLDATDPLMSFGLLPLRCLNDQGRVMSNDKPSYWMDMPTKQRKSRTQNIDLTLQPNGKLKGTVITYSKGYEGYEKRKAIRKFNTTDEYVENLDERMPKIKILNADIANLDSLDLPLMEKYEVEIDAYDNLNTTRLAFNPYLLDRLTVNPFKMAERTYPVDMGMPSDTHFTINLTVPAGYMVETIPQPNALALPNAGGKFLTEISTDSGKLTFSSATLFSKSVYESEEYPYLKEFYNKMIAAQRAEIVFKKK